MGQGAHIGAAVTAAIALMAFVAPLYAADVPAETVDMSGLLGVWGDGAAFNCKSDPGTESQPVSVAKEENGGYSVSAYEFYCSLSGLEQRKTSVVAETRCGHEGTDEQSSGNLELGLMSDGHMMMAHGGLNVLTRCPVAN